MHSTRGILPLCYQIFFVQKLSTLEASTQEFPAVSRDAEDYFFLHISLQLPFLPSVQVCYDFFTPSKTVLTFRYISSHVTKALVSIIFNLLFDQMPSEVIGHPPLNVNKLLTGFVTAKLHMGPRYAPLANDLAPIFTVCISLL